jgi:hypothetical protein
MVKTVVSPPTWTGRNFCTQVAVPRGSWDRFFPLSCAPRLYARLVILQGTVRSTGGKRAGERVNTRIENFDVFALGIGDIRFFTDQFSVTSGGDKQKANVLYPL